MPPNPGIQRRTEKTIDCMKKERAGICGDRRNRRTQERAISTSAATVIGLLADDISTVPYCEDAQPLKWHQMDGLPRLPFLEVKMFYLSL
ncbi:hypothetical protein DAI22_08g162800 [Oryza sativa Japonica Group]|nr:hypothetical protein DAI22_08g162800 [Oryza sativa Japonica Group]